VRVTFKRPWSDGTTGVSLTYAEFIEKLMALIPPPRQSLTHWKGLFAPASKLRQEIAPKPEARTLCVSEIDRALGLSSGAAQSESLQIA
jgi:hypothetical protein